MARRSSNSVRRERLRARAHGTTLDRNGIPVLDARASANKLTRRCHATQHRFVRTSRKHVETTIDATIYKIEVRCLRCGETSRFHESEEVA